MARYWNLRLREIQKGIDLKVAIDQLVKRIKSFNIVFDDTVTRTGTGSGTEAGTGTGQTDRTGTGNGTDNANGTGTGTDTENDTGTGPGSSTTPAAPTIEERWKAAIKLLRKVRDTAYDHRAVHLKATLAQYMSLKFTDDEESDSDENKTKI